jgi:hypothetical protein
LPNKHSTKTTTPHPPQGDAAPSSFVQKHCKDTHYKNKHPHIDNPHHDSNNNRSHTGVSVRAMLASTIQSSNTKRHIRPTQPLAGRASDSSGPNSVPRTHAFPVTAPGSTPTTSSRSSTWTGSTEARPADSEGRSSMIPLVRHHPPLTRNASGLWVCAP